MQTVRIYRLKDLDRRTRARLEAALHSQSIQMVCQQFLANVQTIKQLRQTNPQHRYPYHPKRYMTVQWPAQAVSRQGKRLILPMGRGRKSFSFHLPNLPEHIGAVSLVWRGGYELHLVVPTAPEADVSALPVQAAVDLGEIHQAAVTTSTGKGLIVTGRGSRACSRAARKAPSAGGACSTPKHANGAGRSAGCATCDTRARGRWWTSAVPRGRKPSMWAIPTGCAKRTRDAITTSV